MNKLYKQGIALVFALFLLVGMAPSALAYEPAIANIHTEVLLLEDGSAQITQTWDVTVASGTEWYLVQDNMGDMEIKNFAVSDETGHQYENVGAWDVDRSLEQKAGQCGIVETGSGYELCWGVGSYGPHTFTASYTMTNFVKGYSDYDGFLVRLVNDDLTADPQHISVNIRREGMDLTVDNTWIWAFGFGGQINVMTDGAIFAESNQPLNSRNYVNIMAKFSPGIFNPTSRQPGSFDEIEQGALADSDYTPDGETYPGGTDYPYEGSDFTGGGHFRASFSIPVGMLVVVPCIIFALFSLVAKIRSGSSYISLPKGSTLNRKDPPYCRTVPLGGDLEASSALLRSIGILPSENPLLGALLLRWMHRGVLFCREDPTGRGDKTTPSLVLQHPPTDASASENQLYQILVGAAGADGVLQEKELYKWAKKNYTQVESWQTTALNQGSAALTARGLTERAQRTSFFGMIKYTQLQLSPSGMQEGQNALGFRQYLKDFTLVNERNAVDVQLWDEYLVFATLFGIADQVMEDFKNIYPAYFERPMEGAGPYTSQGDLMRQLIWINTITRAASSGMSAGRQAAQSSNSSFGGGGGGSSFGGGGGFSGGGSGGGSR